MNKIFKNTELDQHLENNGYVIIDFLDKDELMTARNLCQNMGFGGDSGKDFRRTVNHATADRKQEIHENFSPGFWPAINRVLLDYTLVRIGIFDKPPGCEGINVHQHVSLVDETRYTPLGAWIPLVDTTIENGTLHVIKASHRILNNPIRPYKSSPFHLISNKLIEDFSTPILIKTGQAVIFHEGLIHWSPPNHTPHGRTAIQLKILPAETASELIFHYRINNEELEKYKVDLKTFRETDLSQSRPGNLLKMGKIKLTEVCYDDSQFIKMMCKSEKNDTRLFRNLIEKFSINNSI